VKHGGGTTRKGAGAVARYFACIGLTLFLGCNSNQGDNERLPLKAAGKPSVTLFAAASTTNVVTDIIRTFEETTRAKVMHSFASSSTLAKQIAAGAPADVYLSANPKWMDYLAERNLIEPDGRIDLLGNRIVLITPKEHDPRFEEASIAEVIESLGNNKLAMGDPTHVPAGIYAKQALASLGLWEQVEAKLAPTRDVRAALVLVERGESPLGIVYATDAAISKKVKVIHSFPSDSHPPIVYPVALVAGRETPTAKKFLSFLRSPKAGEIFVRYGFAVLK
jgi:molybdate transport system substrate-binding protein